MDIPVSLVVVVLALGAMAAAVLLVPRVMGPSSPWRRRVPGLLLLGLGMALFGSQLPADQGRLLLGVAMLVAWSGVAIGLIAARGWARVPGVVLSVVGVAVAWWVLWRVNGWTTDVVQSTDRVLVDIFFLADGPSFSWMEVAIDSLIFAVLSAVAAAFLLLPYRPPDITPG